MATTYTQHPLLLPALARGSHLITPHIESSLHPHVSRVKCGLLHLFLQHTSAALSLNENWDEDVRRDMSDALDGLVREDKVGFFLVFFWFSISLFFGRGRGWG